MRCDSFTVSKVLELVAECRDALTKQLLAAYQRVLAGMFRHVRRRRDEGDTDTAEAIIGYLIRCDEAVDSVAVERLHSDEWHKALLLHVQRRLAGVESELGDAARVHAENVSAEREFAEVLLRTPESEFNQAIEDAVKSQFAASPLDGPGCLYSFCWCGTVYPGMMPTSWRLVRYLWKARHRTASFKDLAGPVWDDHAETITGSQVGSARRNANRFFEENEIPLRVTIKGSETVKLTSQG